MDKREHPTSDLRKTEQPLSDRDLEAVNGGADMVAGLGGPDTRQSKGHEKWIDVVSMSF
jgi:hypothetical protein